MKAPKSNTDLTVAAEPHLVISTDAIIDEILSSSIEKVFHGFLRGERIGADSIKLSIR